MEKILVSACLLGRIVRYDGKPLSHAEKTLKVLQDRGHIISVCPEVDAGMSVPRAPAEIIATDQSSGMDLLNAQAKVVDRLGADVTAFFLRGAQIALSLCREHKIKLAVLTESSPSCGSSQVYDGTFSGRKITGEGITAALLRSEGIQVFNQHQAKQVSELLLTF